MNGDIFSKLQEARLKIEEAKQKLNSMVIEIRSENNEVKILANANKTITSIDISEDFIKTAGKSELEEMLLKTVNKALDEAARKGEMEMKNITRDVLPNFPGLI